MKINQNATKNFVFCQNKLMKKYFKTTDLDEIENLLKQGHTVLLSTKNWFAITCMLRGLKGFNYEFRDRHVVAWLEKGHPKAPYVR